NHGGTHHRRRTYLRAAQELPERSAHHPVTPRKTGRHRLSRPSERQRGSPHRTGSTNRGYLRFAHHRPAVPQGPLAGKGASNYVGRDTPWMVGREISRRIAGHAPEIPDGIFRAGNVAPALFTPRAFVI